MTPVMRKHFLILMFFEVFLANLTLGKSGVSTDIFFGCLLREVRQGCQLCFRRVLWPVLLRSGEQGSAMEENDQDSLPSKMIDVIQHRSFCGPARTASQYIYRFYDTYVLVLLHMLESRFVPSVEQHSCWRGSWPVSGNSTRSHSRWCSLYLSISEVYICFL